MDKIKLNKSEKFMIALATILYVLVIIRNTAFPEDRLSFLWFCDLALPLLIIAYTFRITPLKQAIINVGFLPQIYLSFNVIMFLITGFQLPFVSSTVDLNATLADPHIFGIIVEILIHLLPINLALLFTYKNKPSYLTFLYSIGLILFTYLLTITFTAPTENINVIYNSTWDNEFYPVLWPIIILVFFVLPTHLIQYMLWKFSEERKSKNSRT